MPIMLDNPQSVQNLQGAVKTYTPKFFDKELTGSGKKTGVLNENQNPGYQAKLNIVRRSTVAHMRHMQHTNGNTVSYHIPLAIAYPRLMDRLSGADLMMPIPDLSEMAKIGTTGAATNADIYFQMKPIHIGIEKTRNVPPPGSSAQTSISRTVSVRYLMELYIIADPNDNMTHLVPSADRNSISEPYLGMFKHDNIMVYLVSDQPWEILWALPKSLTSFTIDTAAVDNYLDNYDLYQAVCQQSEQWQEKADTVMETIFSAFAAVSSNGINYDTQIALGDLLRYLENYNIPLNLYRNIYMALRKHFNATDAATLCKQNMNLLLSDTLHALHNNKANLSPIPANGPAGIAAMSKRRFSPEQQRAIASQSPLSLVQAGAGTGKSTVILGRIDWLVASGIDPNDITVLSFTNAAADHIKELNPDVHSMTIARMIHTIYSANYPTHELSTLDTIVNSLEIYFPSDDTARRFMNLCAKTGNNAKTPYTVINNFIEDNFDAVMHMLDTIKQTSLELEIMICYQQIDKLIEPPEVSSKHLIVDEVQDNSVFEFIYTLKYVNKHRESLFIVGDCSQTLYEFRASDPRALNVLEGSGVFDAYQLQVNYRSNQEILDFANTVLANIEANQYANIRLRANSLKQVTEKSFNEKVHLKYYRLHKKGDFQDMLPIIVGRDLRSYIDGCLAKGEQIAVLAYQRNTVEGIMRQIEAIWPDKTIANLIPVRTRDNTVLSEFIRNHWNEVQFMPTKNITDIIIRSCMDSLVSTRSYQTASQNNKNWIQQRAAQTLTDWQARYHNELTVMQTNHVNGLVSLDDFLSAVKQSMLDFEIQHNAVRQALISQKNRENKLQNSATDSDFVMSTIHSAKGLEFPHVIIAYDNKSAMEDEANKRMYYVALTRAMESEFIIAYDTMAKPAIEQAYLNIQQTLHQIAPGYPNTHPAAKAQALLDAHAAGKLEMSLEGAPAYQIDTAPVAAQPIIYTAATLDNYGVQAAPALHMEYRTRVDDMDAMLVAARALVEMYNTKGIVLKDEDNAEENEESDKRSA